MPDGRINYTAAKGDNWYNILVEADNHDKVEAIVKIAINDYPACKDELEEGLRLYLIPRGGNGEPGHQAKKVLDAAIRSEVRVEESTLLLVLVRDQDSEGLIAILKLEPEYMLEEEDVRHSRFFKLYFPVDKSGNLLPTDIEIVVSSPDFRPATQSKIIEITPFIKSEDDSAPVEFFLTPLRTGELQVIVEVYQKPGNIRRRVGSKPLAIVSLESTSKAAQYKVISMMFDSLNTFEAAITMKSRMKLRDQIQQMQKVGGGNPLILKFFLYIFLFAGIIGTGYLALGSLKTQILSPGTPTATATVTETATATSTPTPTETPPSIAELMEKEATAVLVKDFELIEEIFAPDASKTDASKSPPQVWNARDRYRETFESEDHHEINHTNLKIEIIGDMATVTNDSCGRFTDTATNQEISYSSPRSDKWTFERDDNGRWWITDLTYGIQSRNPDHFYEFEDETDGCWRVRIDNDEPQGDPPYALSEMGYEGDGSLKFPFNLSEISTRRAQVMHENMPFAGEFSAYVYIPQDAPDDLIASFFAMELNQAPCNYHGIETGEGQIHQLIPGQWTEVRWEDDVSQWEPIVHLLGIEIRQESGGFYDGYVLIDNIDIKSK